MQTTQQKREYLRQWQERNRERLKEQRLAKYAANREVYLLRSKINRERYKATGPTVIKSEKCCCKCDTPKPIDQFAKNSSTADGRSSTCKTCAYERTKQWRKINPDKMRKISRDQSARNTASGKGLKYSRKYFQANKEICYKRTQEWKKSHPDKWRASMRDSHHRRMAKDPTYKFSVKIRSKIRLLMRGLRKSAPTEVLLGCKIAELRKWLELHWQPGMSWDNYGLHGWHIDHKRPVASFDLSKPEDQRACFHYTNLQPLWALDNIRKSDSFAPVQVVG